MVLPSEMASEVSERPHLSIDESVPQNNLLMLEKSGTLHLIQMGQLIPLGCDRGSPTLIVQPLLIGGELVDEGCADLQIGPSAIKEFQGLQEGPAIPFHDIGSKGACCPTLSSH
jgi:hypothetical protein